jgi:KDO2-lipid IV(A) lauroyltransferase
MRFKIVYTEPYVFEPTGDRDADVHAILTELNRRLEEYIRLYPEQYLWSHRRWRAPATTAAPDTPSSAPPPSSETQPAPAESPRP